MIDYSSYSDIIPKVSFDGKELESYMIDFMMENLSDAKGVNGYLGLVMLRLGFKVDDKIKLRGFCRDNREDNFQCIVNGIDYYDIKFENVGNKKLHTKITLINFETAITYECFPLRVSELGVRIIPVREEIRYADGVRYIREYSREGAKYITEYLDYQFELEVVKPKNLELPMYDSSGRYSRYRLDNEDVLKKYLSDFFPVWGIKDIVKIYRSISEISLGYDVSKYESVSLKCIIDGKVTDLIYLKNGELENFGITLLSIGRTLFLNKDGSWTCEMCAENNLFNYSMNVIGDETNYNISIKNNIDPLIVGEIIKSDTEDAKENIEDVKRLVRTIFNNSKNDSN